MGNQNPVQPWHNVLSYIEIVEAQAPSLIPLRIRELVLGAKGYEKRGGRSHMTRRIHTAENTRHLQELNSSRATVYPLPASPLPSLRFAKD
jgi:hypothetical protein